MRNIAVILAGGSGSRMRSDIPKQFLFVADMGDFTAFVGD